MVSKQTKACDITMKVRQQVLDRDGKRCIVCGTNYGLEIAHYIPRSHGGLGVKENLVCLCVKHHRAFDGDERDIYKPLIKSYLQGWYMDSWNEKDLVYDKYKWVEK